MPFVDHGAANSLCSDEVVTPESARIAPEASRPTLRQRFAASRIGRAVFGGLISAGLISGGVAVAAAPAQAESSHTYTIENTDGDGVWLHGDPGLGDEGDLITVVPEGTRVTADCYVNDTPVGEKNNPAWLRITYDGKRGFISDTFTSSRWNKDNTLHDQGLTFCGEEAQGGQGSENEPPADIMTSVSYDRDAAVRWANEHYDDVPPYDAPCTWFVSNALWAGGLPRDPGRWTDEGVTKYKVQTRPGTKAAWSVQHFLNYMDYKYPLSRFVRLDSDDFRNNRVPNADPGDVIIYDWEDDGDYDHATFITNMASGEYPEVTEWGVYDGRKPTDYPRRGWTYSKASETWLQNKYPRVVAYLLDIDTTQVGRF